MAKSKVRYTDRQCLYCGVTFGSFRDDVHFCTPRHKAAYDRAAGAGNGYDGHADLPLEHIHYCEWCGKEFATNDYAERGGQRSAKYCKSAHRVAAWRARNAEKGTYANYHENDQPDQNSARYKARKSQVGGKGTSQNKGTSQGGNKGTSQSAGASGSKRTSDENVKRTSTAADWSREWPMPKSVDAAYQLLKLRDGAGWDTVRRHYKKMVQEYHPDVNKEPWATHATQCINRAYEILCKLYGKK